VADDYQGEIRVGQPIVPPRKGYSGAFVTLVFLLLIGAAGGYVWMNYDSLMDGARRWSSGSPQVAGTDDTSDLAKELHAFQQQTTEALGSTRQLLDAQQEQLKGLTGQIADLTAKIDKMQPSAAPAPPVVQAQPQPQPAPQRPASQAAAPARAAVTAPRKRPAVVSRPEGAISVGGAPLPAPGAPAR
jgi:uncharacterized coiled-coil protein SlyX